MVDRQASFWEQFTLNQLLWFQKSYHFFLVKEFVFGPVVAGLLLPGSVWELFWPVRALYAAFCGKEFEFDLGCPNHMGEQRLNVAGLTKFEVS